MFLKKAAQLFQRDKGAGKGSKEEDEKVVKKKKLPGEFDLPLSEPDQVASLPVELQFLIFSYLPATDVLIATRVCQRWYEICESDHTWKQWATEHIANTKGLYECVETEQMSWKDACLQYVFSFGSSNILSLKHRKQLLKWLQVDEKGVSWKLIYRGTQDGFKVADLKRCCWDSVGTVTICKTPKPRNCVFGGYNPVSWKQIHAHANAPPDEKPPDLFTTSSKKAFIFSLENVHGKPATQIFPKSTALSNSCQTHDLYGALWGNGYDLGVLGHPNGDEPRAWCRLGAAYPAPYSQEEIGDPHYFFNGQPRDFIIEEVEVYAKRSLTS